MVTGTAGLSCISPTRRLRNEALTEPSAVDTLIVASSCADESGAAVPRTRMTSFRARVLHGSRSQKAQGARLDAPLRCPRMNVDADRQASVAPRPRMLSRTALAGEHGASAG